MEESLSKEKARIKHLKGKCAAEAEKRQQLLAERRKTNQAASSQLAKSEKSFQELESKIVNMKAE